MKRKGKCVGKKSYKYKHVAINAAAQRYKHHGQELGVYECPTCLDFHLTSKYCNLSHRHNDWLKKHIAIQYEEFLLLEKQNDPARASLRARRRRKRRARKQRERANARLQTSTERNTDTLSQSAMATCFQSFTPTVHKSAPRHWWSRIMSEWKNT